MAIVVFTHKDKTITSVRADSILNVALELTALTHMFIAAHHKKTRRIFSFI